MEIPKPAYQLDIHGVSHGAMTGRMLEGIEKILMTESRWRFWCMAIPTQHLPVRWRQQTTHSGHSCRSRFALVQYGYAGGN